MTFERVRYWIPEAEAGLIKTLIDCKQDLINEINAGGAKLWRCFSDTWLVTRAEGSELVVVCLQGKHGAEVIRLIYTIAKKQNFKTVRFHTSRKGLHRLVARCIPRKVDYIETVYGVTL